MRRLINSFMLLKISGKEGAEIVAFRLLRGFIGVIKTILLSITLPVALVNTVENFDLFGLLFPCGSFLVLEVVDILILDRVDNTTVKKLENTMKDNILLSLYKHSSEIDMKYLDDKSYYDKNILAINSIPGAVSTSLGIFVLLGNGIFSIILNNAYLMQVSAFSGLFVMFLFALIYANRFAITRWALDVRTSQSTLFRKIEYNFEFRSGFSHAKEIKVEKIRKLHDEAFSDESNKLIDIINGTLKKIVFFMCTEDFLNGVLIKVIFLLFLAYESLVLGKISIISVAITYSATVNISNSFMNLLQTIISMDSVAVYANVYRDFIDVPSDIDKGNEHVEEINEIEFKNVGFSYDNEHFVLDNVSFVVKQGMKVALVGRNGSGKSTLLKLILRLYEFTNGEILINGKDIRTLDLDEYREKISVLFQDVRLINATLKENVTLGKADDRQKMLEVLNYAGMSELVESLPKGEETNLGHELFDDGRNLSGGQQQKLLLARALYKESSVIILDEPTAHIDMQSENEFYNTVFSSMNEKTVIYITHRMISTKKADLIIVFDEDGISETGTHEELMNNDGLYKEMYMLQATNSGV